LRFNNCSALWQKGHRWVLYIVTSFMAHPLED